MAACADQEMLLGALVDGELDAANVALIEAHIARCDGCREELERIQAIRTLTTMAGVRHAAPQGLSTRLAALPELSERAPKRFSLPGWLAPGATGAIAASLAILVLSPMTGPSPVDEELVSSHIRSLQPGHLTDVETTNEHIVKPWFNGRIDFSPPVPELADQGFPLAGGRLDSLDGKTVAAIVYHRRLHTVNLFVWRAKETPSRSFVKDGFAVSEWSHNGLRYAAVSDIAPQELGQFQRLFVARSG